MIPFIQLALLLVAMCCAIFGVIGLLHDDLKEKNGGLMQLMISIACIVSELVIHCIIRV
jgi:hypothetical protein